MRVFNLPAAATIPRLPVIPTAQKFEPYGTRNIVIEFSISYSWVVIVARWQPILYERAI
jgi:hypothetical protein